MSVPVTLKMRLGWDDRTHQCARARAPRAGRRRATDHRARAHALPVLQGPRRLGGGARGQGQRLDSGRRERRHLQLRGCRSRARGLGRRCGDDRPRGARAVRGCPDRSAAVSPAAGASSAPPLATQLRDHRSALRRDARRTTVARSAAAMRASISAGRSMRRPRRRAHPTPLLKAHRGRVLTADDPAAVRRHLADAYAAFASAALPASGSAQQRGTNARGRPHEPARADADAAFGHRGRRARRAAASRSSWSRPTAAIANANAAAESFFEASLPLLRRHRLRDLVPFGSPLARAHRAGARARRGGQRVQGRSRHAAQSRRAPGRPVRGAAAGAAGPRGRHAAGAHDRRQDGPPAHPSRRRALGDRARGHARARDQESALRHPRRGAAARAIGRRRRPHLDAADLRRGRPHREAGRPHGSVHRRAADRARTRQHPRRARAREAPRRNRASRATSSSSRTTIPRCRRCSPIATSSSRCSSIS